jgi:hypothetical protein
MEAVVTAYMDCRRHKRNTNNQLTFEADLERNLTALWHDLRDGRYRIGRSLAFVVVHPKIREVWAAERLPLALPMPRRQLLSLMPAMWPTCSDSGGRCTKHPDDLLKIIMKMPLIL